LKSLITKYIFIIVLKKSVTLHGFLKNFVLNFFIGINDVRMFAYLLYSENLKRPPKKKIITFFRY